ncbi:MAG: SRPBCC family protein [Bacteroidia bacterium]|nr:SRPBCC family protein [Bacteroidia bacterium]NND25299.1 transcription activator effector-binding protein [Flavobacteriaceae bacterium]MBT8279599.1 SRPBCC family protein [Bacteroidia bacterium]NNK59301.1 transcription activator effector-binding protein [Flavobacteriaceae bacterium]NNL34020.1 transcription activator effector-binding protein [Flavobacteriaceae bacterium]
MKVLKYLIFILLILIIGGAIYVAVQPNEFTVSRSRTMDAPAAVIYDNVIDYKKWEAWSAWLEKNPNTRLSYPEQTRGVGGSFAWEDDDGPGNIKTIATEENASISQEMQFGEYEPSNVEWSFEPNETGQTHVTWEMKSKNIPFVFKMFSVISGGFDNMIGPDFERGLEKLDSVVVASVNEHGVKIEGIKEYGGGFYLYKTTNANSSNISQKMGENYGGLMSYLMQNNIAMAGMPLTVYHEMNNESDTVIMSNGLPVKEKIDPPKDSDIICGYMPKMKTLKGTFHGNYNYLPMAWNELMTHIETNNLEVSDQKPFEIYTNDPGNFPNPSDWITEIYIPLKE